MMKHKIVLIPFPFDDFSQTKVRPALCLTHSLGKYEHLIVAFISSRLPQEMMETDILIHKGSSSFVKSGLLVDSVIRIHKMVTVPKQLIKRQLGILDEDLQNEVTLRLQLLFNS